jgi:hypothetical protein
MQRSIGGDAIPFLLPAPCHGK